MAISFRSVFAGLGLVGAEPVVVACDGERDASVEEPVHMAAAMVVSEKMSPQDATLRLVVRMTDPCW